MADIITKAKAEKRALTDEEKRQLDEALENQSKKDEPKEEEEKSEVKPEDEPAEPVKEEEERSENSDNQEDETPEVEEENTPEAETPTEDEQPEENKEEEEEETPTPKEEESKRSNITMNKKFSLLRAIRSVANNQQFDEIDAAVIAEGKRSMSGCEMVGQIQLPLGEKRTLSVTGTSGETVSVEVQNILEPLRDNLVLTKAGAHYLSGLKGNVKVPVLGAASASWEGETSTVSAQTPSVTAVELSPRRLSCQCVISRQFMMQDDSNAESVLYADIQKAIAEKLQKTVLSNGKGIANTPDGIFPTGTTATIATYADLCNKEADVEDANVGGNLAYIMSNKAKAKVRAMAKSAKSNELVMEGGQIDGTPVFNTSSVAGTNFAVGDWSQLYLAEFGGLSITVDPYSKAGDASIVLTINAYFDAKLARPNAIVFGQF